MGLDIISCLGWNFFFQMLNVQDLYRALRSTYFCLSNIDFLSIMTPLSVQSFQFHNLFFKKHAISFSDENPPWHCRNIQSKIGHSGKNCLKFMTIWISSKNKDHFMDCPFRNRKKMQAPKRSSEQRLEIPDPLDFKATMRIKLIT